MNNSSNLAGPIFKTWHAMIKRISGKSWESNKYPTEWAQKRPPGLLQFSVVWVGPEQNLWLKCDSKISIILQDVGWVANKTRTWPFSR